MTEESSVAPAKPVQQQMAFDQMLGENAEDAAQDAAENTSISVFAKPIALTSDDVIIPRLRLAQGLTKEVQDGNAKPGEFLLSGAGPRNEIAATVLAIAKFRRLTNDTDGSVACRSEDGYVGVGDPGGDCEECPLSKWINAVDGKGKNTPPACQFGYRYLLEVEGYGQCVYEMKRTAIPAAKALNAMVVRFGYGATKIVIKAQKGTGARGTYYTPIIVPMSAA
jgi:hypothetical protein